MTKLEYLVRLEKIMKEIDDLINFEKDECIILELNKTKEKINDIRNYYLYINNKGDN